MVGRTDILNIVELCRGLPIQYCGPAPRSDVGQFYQDADVFVLPTLSDGFAITLLEAQAWRLPVVATTRCGEAIQNEIDGVVLDDPTAENIAATLRRFLAAPELLASMSSHTTSEAFGIDRLARQLQELNAGWATEATCAQ